MSPRPGGSPPKWGGESGVKRKTIKGVCRVSRITVRSFLESAGLTAQQTRAGARHTAPLIIVSQFIYSVQFYTGSAGLTAKQILSAPPPKRGDDYSQRNSVGFVMKAIDKADI